jgi:hypothetical protein
MAPALAQLARLLGRLAARQAMATGDGVEPSDKGISETPGKQAAP